VASWHGLFPFCSPTIFGCVENAFAEAEAVVMVIALFLLGAELGGA
jgi:hypothetical protein